MTTQAKPHGFVTRGIHWLSAVLIGFGYFRGLDSVNQLAEPSLFMTEIVFALSIGALFLLRLFWTKKIGGVTRLPDNAPRVGTLGVQSSAYGPLCIGLWDCPVWIGHRSRLRNPLARRVRHGRNGWPA